MKTIQELNESSNKIYHIHSCENACTLCGFHTNERNGSGQVVHDFCMKEFSNWQKEYFKKHAKECSMCGNVRKFVEGTNVCKKCLRSAF